MSSINQQSNGGVGGSAAAAPAATPGPGAVATQSLKIYRTVNISPGGNSQLKKTSITPRGTRTFLSENTTLDRTNVQVNKPDPTKSKFMLKHKNIDGSEYMSEREFRRGEPAKWDDKRWVQALNQWRIQNFDRLFRHDPEYQTKLVRPRWSLAEITWLEYKIRRHGNKHGVQLNGKDWEKISREHERRFVGTITKKGEELMNGKTSCSDQEIRRREPTSIRAMFIKMPELQAILQKVIEDFSDAEEESSSDEEKDEEHEIMSEDE